MANANLRALREGLGVSQEGLARRTRNLTTRTVANAERGQRVTYDSATQILEAVNELLAEAGKPPVTLDQLGLNLY
jgi:DNA-binding transcriptional regulator YiaG